MYKDITKYLEAGLRLKDKRQHGDIDGFVTKAYHAVTKKGIIRAMGKIENYQHTQAVNGKQYIDSSPSKLEQQERQRAKALAICTFMLDNFEKRMRAVRAMYSRRTVKRHSDRYKYMGKLKGQKRALREPKWLSEKDKSLITAIYKEAKALRKGGLKVHVDHIIPLCGEKISGLHIPENLEIVPALDNLLKNNQWEVA